MNQPAFIVDLGDRHCFDVRDIIGVSRITITSETKPHYDVARLHLASRSIQTNIPFEAALGRWS